MGLADYQTRSPEAGAQQSPPLALGAPDGRPEQARTSGRRWLTSPLFQGVLALAVYCAVWLPTVVRSLVSHPGQAQLLQSSPDPNFYVWALGWWPYAVAHGLNPLSTNLIGAPGGHSLAWVTTVPPLGLLAAPLTVTVGPVAAFNLLTALALPVSAWAAFLACRRLTGKFVPALVGGAVYGFSAYEFRHLVSGQLNLCWALLPAILVYLVVAWWDGGVRRFVLVIAAGLVLAAQFYLFLETFADLTALLVMALLLGVAVSARAGWRKVLRLAGLLGLAYLIAIALAAPYLAAALSAAAPTPPPGGSLDLTSLWLPTEGRGLVLAGLAHAQTGPLVVTPGCSVGIPLLAVVVVLAVTRWRSRLVWFLVSGLVLVMAAALGPVLYIAGKPVAVLPWHGLYGLPFVRNAYPARLMLFAFLILAVATAVLLAGVPQQTQRRWRARWSLAGRCLLGVLVVAFAALNVAGSLALAPQTTVPAFISSGDYHRQLAHGEIVIVVAKVRNAGMLWQSESGFYWRLAGGFINKGFDPSSDLPVQAQGMASAPVRVAQFEAYVRADHIGAILVEASDAAPWTRVFRLLGLTGHLAGGVIVYPTDGCRTCHGVTMKQIRQTIAAS
jgi:hypothetical protein